MEKVCVAIRVRPPSHENINRGLQWKVVNNSIALLNTAGAPVSGHTFAFGKFLNKSLYDTGIGIASVILEPGFMCRLERETRYTWKEHIRVILQLNGLFLGIWSPMISSV